MRIDKTQNVIHTTSDLSLIAVPYSHAVSDSLYLICQPRGTHEVRVTDTNLVVLTGWFDGREAISHAILDLSRAKQSYGIKELLGVPESVSLSPCPIPNELLALVGNRIKTGITITKDHGIITIDQRLLDDGPRTRNGFFLRIESQPGLLTKEIEVSNYLSGLGFPDHGMAKNWNGAHFIDATLFDRSRGDRTHPGEHVEVTSLRVESLWNLELRGG
jgi:hypothetical protein